MIEKIDTLSSSMVENGMYQHFASLLEFKQYLLLRNIDTDDNDEWELIRPFTMEQLQ